MNVLRRNNVRVMGHGSRTLLFVNGFGCDQSIWRAIAPAFSSEFRLIFFDHMGAGHSDTTAYDPTKYASLAGYTQDLLDICRQLQLKQTLLIGHSVGAIIGMLAAIEEPAWFERLLLLCPSPCYINHPNYHGGFEVADIDSILAYMTTDYVGWADSFAAFLLGTPDRPSMAVELAHSFCQNDPAITKQFARVTLMADNRHDVGRLQVPCLLVQCAHDLVAPREVGEFLLAAIPQATLLTLPVSGHCPHVSAPAETLSAIRAFVAT